MIAADEIKWEIRWSRFRAWLRKLGYQDVTVSILIVTGLLSQVVLTHVLVEHGITKYLVTLNVSLLAIAALIFCRSIGKRGQ